MSNTLVVYYSRKGTTKTAAEKLADYLNCDITEITSPKKYRGLFGFIAGGRAAMSEQKIRIDEPEKSAEDYEMVIICTPVWASNIPPAVRTYLTIENSKIKNHSFLLTSGEVITPRLLNNSRELPGNRQRQFTSPALNGKAMCGLKNS